MSKLTMNVEDLTLGEIEEFEKASGGQTIAAVQKGEVGASAITALVWVFKKRENPDYSLDDARTVKLSELQWDDENPTEGGS